MPEIGTSGSMSEDGKRGVAKWPKLPRLSSTLPPIAAADAAPASDNDNPAAPNTGRA
jgi:hypothetical protein